MPTILNPSGAFHQSRRSGVRHRMEGAPLQDTGCCANPLCAVAAF